MAKRAYKEDHQFDEDAMPCICTVCDGWFDLDDGAPNPRKDNEVICEGCAEDIQKEIDIEEEIEDLKSTISDAEYTIRDARKRLEELDPKKTSEGMLNADEVIERFCTGDRPRSNF